MTNLKKTVNKLYDGAKNTAKLALIAGTLAYTGCDTPSKNWTEQDGAYHRDVHTYSSRIALEAQKVQDLFSQPEHAYEADSLAQIIQENLDSLHSTLNRYKTERE